MKEIRKKLTYANVMSSLAVFLVLGGATAFAATQLAKNSVGSAQLKPGAVTATKIRQHSVTGSKIADGTITGSDIAPKSISGSSIAPGSISGSSIAPGSIPPDALQQQIPAGTDTTPPEGIFVSPEGRVTFRITMHAGETKDMTPTGWSPFSVTATCTTTNAKVVMTTSGNNSFISIGGSGPAVPFTDPVTLVSVDSRPPEEGKTRANENVMPSFVAFEPHGIGAALFGSAEVNSGPNEDECVFIGGGISEPLEPHS